MLLFWLSGLMGAVADSGLLTRATDGIIAYDEDAIDGRSFVVIVDDIVDGSGTPFNYTGVTATCAAWSGVGAVSPVVTFDTTWSTVAGRTRLKISKDDTGMTGLALGRRNRRCVWSLWFDDGTDSIAVWAAHDSNLYIHGRG